MSHNFINNNTGQGVLMDWVNTLISISEEMKLLVGSPKYCINLRLK